MTGLAGRYGSDDRLESGSAVTAAVDWASGGLSRRPTTDGPVVRVSGGTTERRRGWLRRRDPLTDRISRMAKATAPTSMMITPTAWMLTPETVKLKA